MIETEEMIKQHEKIQSRICFRAGLLRYTCHSKSVMKSIDGIAAETT